MLMSTVMRDICKNGWEWHDNGDAFYIQWRIYVYLCLYIYSDIIIIQWRDNFEKLSLSCFSDDVSPYERIIGETTTKRLSIK